MEILEPLPTLALTIGLINLGTPLAYYLYAKKRWLPRPWNLEVDKDYRPRSTIMVQTYNEVRIVEGLDSIYGWGYPKNFTEIVVD